MAPQTFSVSPRNFFSCISSNRSVFYSLQKMASRLHQRDRQMPLLIVSENFTEYGYYIRAKAVDHCFKQFLMQTGGHPQRQILSLGAGFDSSYFRLKAGGLLKNVIMYEVDFPDVVSRKAALITNEKELAELVGSAGEIRPAESGIVCLSGTDYRLLGVDLSELEKLDEGLIGAGLNLTCPTLILSEVVLTYMDNARSSAVIQWASEHFASAVFVIYEQIRPADPFGQVMQKHFKQLNSTLHALVEYPDREAQKKRFLDLGWEESTCVDMNEFYFGFIPKEERKRLETLEPFDEFEEWHLKCSHYFILTAFKGELKICSMLNAPTGSLLTKSVPFSSKTISASPCEVDSKVSGLRRYGHRSCLIKSNVVITTGGFGEQAGQHGRLKDLQLSVKSGAIWEHGPVTVEDTEQLWDARIFHSMTPISDDQCVIVGGRLSPLNPSTNILCLKCRQKSDFDSCSVNVSVQEVCVDMKSLSPRWRHSATGMKYKDQSYLFIYGGCSPTDKVLNDWYFLNLEDFSRTEILVEGFVPEGRHSHSACLWNGAVVIAGGLGPEEMPLGSIYLLIPTTTGFTWQEVEASPSVIPRYSHTAHIVDDKLLLVGGVLIHSDTIPGVTVIDLKTGQCVDYQINTAHLEWPLMLHNHSSVLMEEEKQLFVIGGGGNCFSFGTHLNQHPVLLSLASVI
nr:PREDICTED: tRNA wybutosine-synthesizing protein 4 isoform X2 [Latimeria chalumnae]|eukprot:XP_005999146.1 PREDICTED: tRNA wybutosine-synthesizing protein 4 isoform X2 [Latimeria chalumnae]